MSQQFSDVFLIFGGVLFEFGVLLQHTRSHLDVHFFQLLILKKQHTDVLYLHMARFSKHVNVSYKHVERVI